MSTLDTQAFPRVGEVDFYDGLSNEFVLAGPPMTELADGTAVTLRDWLTHYHPDGARAWSGVTFDFYHVAMRNPAVNHTFATLSEQDAHLYFLAIQIIAINHDGITVGDMRHLKRQSAPADRPISTETYNAIISALCEALTRQDVPDAAILGLVTAAMPLRDAVSAPRAQRRSRTPGRGVPTRPPNGPPYTTGGAG